MLQAHAAGEGVPAAGQATLALDRDNHHLAGQTAGELEVTLSRWLRDAAGLAARRGRALLASLVTPVEPQDPLLAFQRARALGPRFFWNDRRSEDPAKRLALVGVGEAHRVEGEGGDRFLAVASGWAGVTEQAWVEGPQVPASGPVFLGGFAFDPAGREAPYGAPGATAATPIRGALGVPGPSPWGDFPAALMRVPQLLLSEWGRACWLTVNAWVEPGLEVEELARRLARGVRSFLGGEPAGKDPAGAALHSAAVASRVPDGDPAPWYEAVARAAQAVREGLVAKVVLARPQMVQLPEAVTPDRILAALAVQNPRATLFCLEVGESAFLGATPEHLAQVAGGWVESMALAGSAPRGATPEEDERLGLELLASPKNREEHQIVVSAVRQALEPLTSRLEVAPEPGLLKLPTIQHLFTPVRGLLKDGATLLQVVERMHPTPAVGGAPKAAALELIRRLEGWDRGWYAGPVGWMDQAGNGAFAVALRSGVLRGREAHLFAGCGIVGASRPEEEYREWQIKLRPMLAALEEACR